MDDRFAKRAFEPMRLTAVPRAFDHPEWVFEPKLDGFRALAYVSAKTVTLVSRKGHAYRSFGGLAAEILGAVRAKEAVLDGEIVCVDDAGRPVSTSLLHRRSAACFYAFDVLWLDGKDLRDRPLTTRKRALRYVLRRSPQVRYVDHVAGCGEGLFDLVRTHDMEGIVAKWKDGPYRAGKPSSWVKIENPDYTQARNRHELLAMRRASGPLPSLF
jgi:bifunctional non-homologous end joining protein LigD